VPAGTYNHELEDTMPDGLSSIDIGRKNAAAVLARRREARTRRANALAAHRSPLSMRVEVTSAAAPVAATSHQTAGFLAAAGDSWFDYPLHDVLTVLDDDYGYSIESAAHRGDPIETMAYQNGQLDKLARCIDKIKGNAAVPKAVLLSGGGNDIAGNEFGMLLNNALSQIGGWNDEIVDGVINQRIAAAYRTMLSAINTYCEQDLGEGVPILIHGYDYPVPDGRGFLGGWGPLPGPWLQPGFAEKVFSDLSTTTALMHNIMDRFHTMLVEIAQEPAFQSNVHVVDLRGTLSSDLTGGAYKATWANELHPTKDGFEAVAKKFAEVLAGLAS
jgi:lysophospholipase L1-like esterase